MSGASYGLIEPPSELRAAMASVRALDPRFQAIPDARVYRWPPGLPALVRVVVGQLVSTRAADTVFERLVARVPLTPDALAACPEETFRGVGLGRAKAGCIRAIARAVHAGDLDLRALADLDDRTAVQVLTRFPGVGPWTAEVYLLFALDRRDVLPASDLGMLVGYQRLAGTPTRPTPAGLRAQLAHLAPLRGVAAFMLWEVYRQPGWPSPDSSTTR